ncbi:MAG: orotidine-5'-phosphate decarboxylase [Calditrichae bacterium]|nr:orotidine-5'-phosphate decarboxylase [Calditrichota bacterium]MCB9057330.1 orotidine-5'-phosphate decarboxylase [Calditrichia bacterium]
MNSTKKELIFALHDIGAVKFGSFKLKSGLTSPFYIDLRSVISYPKIMTLISSLLKEAVNGKKFDLITGIPYTALPMASILSVELNKPLIYQRKEPKAYGTAKSIEGVYSPGDSCLVIDDVMSTGESKIEIAEALGAEGIKIRDFVILVDRSYNGRKFMSDNGYNLISIISIFDIVNTLYENKLLSSAQKQQVEEFMAVDQSNQAITTLNNTQEQTTNFNSHALIKLIQQKKSNLVASLDVDNQKDFFRILNAVADDIVLVKTHVDILNDFDETFVNKLKKLSAQKKFMIFEDRKFADIGNTVRKQFHEGIYKIAEWADFITVHALPGDGILKGLFEDSSLHCSAFLLAAMSAKGALITDAYTRNTIAMGDRFKEKVSGFIGFAKNLEDLKKLKAKIPQDMLLLMPGVNLDVKGDSLGQQYVSVNDAVQGGADLIIVGRGIIGQKDPGKASARYREAGWKALSESGRI